MQEVHHCISSCGDMFECNEGSQSAVGIVHVRFSGSNGGAVIEGQPCARL